MLRLLVVLADREVHEASCASRTCSWSAANTRSLQLWAIGRLGRRSLMVCFVALGRLPVLSQRPGAYIETVWYAFRILGALGATRSTPPRVATCKPTSTTAHFAMADTVGLDAASSSLPSASPSSLASPPPGHPSKAPLPPLQSVHKLFWVTAEKSERPCRRQVL